MSNRLTFSLASLILILGLVFATAPAMAQDATTDLSAATIPSHGFGVIAAATTFESSGGQTTNAITALPTGALDITGTLPNLYNYFEDGVTIVLAAPINVMRNGNAVTPTIALPTVKTGSDIEAKDIVISEIMWGLNANAANFSAQTNQQFIELYNTTAAGAASGDGAANINVTAGWRIFFYLDHQDYLDALNTDDKLEADHDGTAGIATDGSETFTVVDIVSNISKGGHSLLDNGQSGALVLTGGVTAKDLISMRRAIDYDKVESITLNKDDAADNRKKQLAEVKSGEDDGSWIKSTRNYNNYMKGSPGKEHFKGAVKPLTASTIDLKKVIINEIGNSSNNKYDWLELRNTSGDKIVIENYQLSNVVGTTKDDVVLVVFPKITIPKDDVLLVVNSDPKLDANHPLAAGVNVITEEGDKAGDLVKNGQTSRYYVNSGLVIPNEHVLFILRSAKDKVGTEHLDKLVDVTGTASIADTANNLATGLWPLVKTGAVNNEIIKGAKVADGAKFGDNTVYHRAKADKTTNDKEIWVASEDAGIGYKRDMPGKGTPGYANNARKEFKDKTADGMSAAPVTISEIMYASGNKLPQWIELYNASMTTSILIDEWRLKLENAEDVPMRETVTVKLANRIIPPNQTVLIVATTARNSGDFPSHRVLDIWKDGLKDKDKLEIDDKTARRDFKFLSETAFKVTLMDKGGNEVDVAGNMGDDGAAAWTLPMAEDGRSSIIRRYDDGEARDGTLPVWSGPKSLKPAGDPKDRGMDGDAGWVLASVSDLNFTATETYYGHDTDAGSPGFRGGGALPVSLSKFRPERLESGDIVIRWITESELNNAGFNILRSETRDSAFTQINTQLIKGKGTTSERTTYEWKDTTAKPNVVYYYQIQDVSLDGQVQTLRMSRLKGDITPAGKLTTTWGELKALQ